MTKQDFSRRSFLTKGAAAGAGAVALAGAATEADAQGINWDQTADVVIIGAGVAGLPAAITARELGASVIIVEENYDIGGRGMLSGGRVQLGGGHALQQKFNIKDNADQVFLDWVSADDAESRYSDRDLVRVFADENVSAYQFLIDNGVEFIEKPIGPVDASSLPRIFVTKEWHIPAEVVAPHRNRNGSGLVRRLAESARKKGAQILLKHKMTRIIREKPMSGRVLGVEVQTDGKTINIRATKGVIVATGGHTGNVNFRRIFDPRLTEEYQQACQPYVYQNAAGEIAAMDIGASLWATAIQTSESGAAITKTRHIGCRWGYASLVYETDSLMFPQAKATGLTVKDWQDIIMVNQFGKRFWDEADEFLQILQRRDGLQRRQEQAQRRRPDLGDLRRRRRGPREMEHQAAECRSRRLVLLGRHAFRVGRPDQEPIPEAADARRGADRNRRPLQFIRRRRRR